MITKAQFEAVFKALNDAGVKYLVAGGIAVNAHGYVRYTNDVDIVLALSTDNIERATGALESLGYRPMVPVKLSDLADESKRRDWIENKHAMVLNLAGPDIDALRVDIFLQTPFDFDEEWDAAPEHSFTVGASIRVVSLPTLIQMKTGTGRYKDMEDLVQLRRIQCLGDANG